MCKYRIIVLSALIILCSGRAISQHKRSDYLFIENKGQWPSDVLYSSEMSPANGRLFIEEGGLTYHIWDNSAIRKAHEGVPHSSANQPRIKGHVFRVKLLGSSSTSETTANGKQSSYYNYFLGNDESKWAGGCYAFTEIKREGIYKNIDQVFYSQDGFFKYDFIARPGSNPSEIRMKYEGAKEIAIENDRIKVTTEVGIIYEQQPIVWQIITDKKVQVACRYRLLSGNEIVFDFPKGYNTNYTLIIDPQLVFSTYSGSFADNFGYTATYDNNGYLYSGSSAFGQNYPTTLGAYQVTHAGGNSNIGQGIDMAITKYDLSGTALVWSTFLGGNGDDLPHSIVTNEQNELFVYGTTGSTNYPVTNGAFDTSFAGGNTVSPTGTGANFPNGTDIVISHFNFNATALIGSTYLGGSGNDGVCTSANLKHNYADEFRGEITLDSDGNVLIVSSTFSTNFPVVNAIQPTIGGMQDAVIVKMTPVLNTIIWSTYLGGNMDDSGFAATFDEAGALYLCGGTRSENFPITSGAAQATFGGGIADCYITKINAAGNAIVASTYWGKETYDQGYFIETDNNGFVYIYGQTTATGSSMIINAIYGTAGSGNLLTKFSNNLQTVIWSTVFGTGSGKPTLSPAAFLVDYCNRIYISGWGIFSVVTPLNPGQNLSPMNTMQVTSDAFDSTCTTGDFYMAVFDENMTQLEYATFYGGSSSSEHVDGGTSRFDSKGIIYQSVCAGCGGFSDFPIQPGNAWSPSNNATGGCNNGVYKFDFQLPITIADFNLSPTGCTNTPIQFTSTSTFATGYQWNFGGQGSSSQTNPTFNFTSPGTYDVTLIVTHPTTCNLTDTITKTIEIVAPINGNLSPLAVCTYNTTLMGPATFNPTYTYSWTPTQHLNNPFIANPIFQPGTSTTYTLQVAHDGCVDTYVQSVEVVELTLQIPTDTTICDEGAILLTAAYSPADASIFWSDSPTFTTILNDSPTDSDILVNPAIPTTYYAQVQKLGCSIQTSTLVNLVSFQTVVKGDFTVCEGDTTTLSILSPNPQFLYHWLPENLILSGQNTPSVEVWIPETTTFTVLSESPDGCEAQDEVIVSTSLLNQLPISASANPSIILVGQSSQLNALPAGYNYNWTPAAYLNNSSIANPLSTPNQDITYTVSVFDDECSAQANVTIRVVDFVCGPPSIYVPNAFTPNNDDLNEKLYVRGNNITKLYFVIYDRWGEKVFETTSQEVGWNGTFKGKRLDPDVYTYYLEATCTGNMQFFDKGNITLIH